MTSSPRREREVAGKLQELKDEAREIAGKATGHPRPEAEGAAEKVCGKVQMKVAEVEKFLGKQGPMTAKPTNQKDTLHLTREESESMGVAFPAEPPSIPIELREHPLHEQVGWALTEDDVAEVLTGEATPESREEVEDFFADMQEKESDRQENPGP